MTVKKTKKKPLRFISRVILWGILIAFAFIYYPLIKKTFVNLSLLKIKEIEITSPPNIPKATIEEISGIKKNTPILQLPIEEISEKIKKHPWIKTVSIKRRLPGKVDIVVESKEVLAIGKQNNKLYYIDPSGKIIDGINLALDNQYLVINSYNGTFAKGLEIIKALNSINTPGVYIKKDIISEIIIDGDNLFTLILSNIPTRIHLNIDNLEKRLINSQKVIADLEIHGETAYAVDATLENGKVVAKGIKKR